MEFNYTTTDVTDALLACGIESGDTAHITGNFGAIGMHESFSRQGTVEGFFDGCMAAIGSGTLVVPTHTFSLCNTDTVFDPASTPSERGPFTEFVRCQQNAVRQFHPFASVSAFGDAAERVCGFSSRHAYGPNTPYERLLELDAWMVSVGISAPLTCSAVHHFEQAMGVPYRYTKEFIHPVLRGREVGLEAFYLFVTYQECDLERDRNMKLFNDSEMQSEMTTIDLGSGELQCYRLRKLWEVAKRMMTDDIYNWVRTLPAKRPYQK